MKPTKQPWAEMKINDVEPLIMHVDMNSCYATMEQQANHLLRGRPVGVCAYATYWGAIISPSVEAKQAGVTVGMSVADALKICPDIFVIQMYPPLYLDAHMRFKRIFIDYTPDVWPKSVDEAVLDLTNTPKLKYMSTIDIAMEIKQRVCEEVGDWVRVNVGIGNNQFLAKLAASFNKPDGLTVIDHNNLRDTYAGLDLLDLPGINVRNKMRLWFQDIHTPLEFLDAPLWKLKFAFSPQRMNGFYWYMRLRGYEVDAFRSKRRTYSNNNTLQIRTNDWEVLKKFVMKLCEKTGRRLRGGGYTAGNVHVWLVYEGWRGWHLGMRVHARIYTTRQIYYYVMKLLYMQPDMTKIPTHIGIEVSELLPTDPQQVGLFDKEFGKGMEFGQGEFGDAERALSRSMDKINDRYGDMVIGSALLAGMDNFILNRIAFGSVKDIADLYEQEGGQQLTP